MKFKVGDKVKFTGSCFACKNKTGVVIEITNRYRIKVNLPKSTCGNWGSGIPCDPRDLELFTRIGEQLLFDFMY